MLNSSLINFYHSYKFLDTEKVIFQKILIANCKEFPIKTNFIHYVSKVVPVVEKILKAKQQNPQANTQHLEDQIDIMVYKLYNLTYEEVKIIDPEIEKLISEEEYEKYETK